MSTQPAPTTREDAEQLDIVPRAPASSSSPAGSGLAYECNGCTVEFYNIAELDEHLDRSRHRVQCHHCTVVFSCWGARQVHYAQLNHWPYYCDRCNGFFTTIELTYLHKRTSRCGKGVCGSCSAKLDLAGATKEHTCFRLIQKRRHRHAQLPCDATSSFSSMSLNRHKPQSRDLPSETRGGLVELWPHDEVGKRTREHGLSRRFPATDDPSALEPSSSAMPQIFGCYGCNKTFTSVIKADAHMTNERHAPFYCDVCAKPLDSDTVHVHKNEEKHWKCCGCRKLFASLAECTYHMVLNDHFSVVGETTTKGSFTPVPRRPDAHIHSEASVTADCAPYTAQLSSRPFSRAGPPIQAVVAHIAIEEEDGNGRAYQSAQRPAQRYDRTLSSRSLISVEVDSFEPASLQLDGRWQAEQQDFRVLCMPTPSSMYTSHPVHDIHPDDEDKLVSIEMEVQEDPLDLSLNVAPVQLGSVLAPMARDAPLPLLPFDPTDGVILQLVDHNLAALAPIVSNSIDPTSKLLQTCLVRQDGPHLLDVQEDYHQFTVFQSENDTASIACDSVMTCQSETQTGQKRELVCVSCQASFQRHSQMANHLEQGCCSAPRVFSHALIHYKLSQTEGFQGSLLYRDFPKFTMDDLQANPTILKCDKCKEAFDDVQSRNAHEVLETHDASLYVCQECNRYFASLEALYTHLEQEESTDLLQQLRCCPALWHIVQD